MGGRRRALSWLGWLRSNRLFFTACQFLNCVAISFLMEKKRKEKENRNRKTVPFNLFAQSAGDVCYRDDDINTVMYIFPRGGREAGFSVDLSVLLSRCCRTEWGPVRGEGGREPGAGGLGARFFSVLSPALPPLHGRALLLSPHSRQACLSLFIYLPCRALTSVSRAHLSRVCLRSEGGYRGRQPVP